MHWWQASQELALRQYTPDNSCFLAGSGTPSLEKKSASVDEAYHRFLE